MATPLSAKMPPSFKVVTTVTSKDAVQTVQNLNTRKLRGWVRGFENWCDENCLEKRYSLNISMLSMFSIPNKQTKTHVCERNLSPMILKSNQMVYS